MLTSLAFVLFATMLSSEATAPCEKLTALSLPHTTITSVKFVAAGRYTSQGPGGRQQTGPMLPDHCRVVAVAAPSSDSHIEIEIWLPAQGWNGKFLAVGNGGFAGTIPYGAIASGLREGYATAGTDTGHKGPDDASFGLRPRAVYAGGPGIPASGGLELGGRLHPPAAGLGGPASR